MNNCTFGLHNITSLILHDGDTVLAADSVLASHVGDFGSFLANTSLCEFSNQMACFLCHPLPQDGACLPILHFKVAHNADNQFVDHSIAFSTSGTTGAVVGAPTTTGAGYTAHCRHHGSASVSAGSHHAVASPTASGDGNLHAGESASVSAFQAGGSASYDDDNLGDGVEAPTRQPTFTFVPANSASAQRIQHSTGRRSPLPSECHPTAPRRLTDAAPLPATSHGTQRAPTTVSPPYHQYITTASPLHHSDIFCT